MTRSVAEVFDDALALDDQDRARLAAKLVESLDGDADAGGEDAWADEIRQRLEKIEAGQTKWLSKDDAIARMHLAARGR